LISRVERMLLKKGLKLGRPHLVKFNYEPKRVYFGMLNTVQS